MRRTERVAYRTKFYSNLSSPTRFDEEPLVFCFAFCIILKRAFSDIKTITCRHFHLKKYQNFK
ncbi:hypothetical protein AUF15_18885 [Enterococcus avium]|nr:hypothetical protein AUF15_18885 [Enterococcus avium]